uniref:ADP-ribosylation factor-like protein 2 n=1 Tax=Timema genevievae TaxID=629358 RepID=A0A7R9JPI8_TIMGE|nr:unnamed protein product [Timema genevievae]
MNKECLVENLHEDSLIAQRVTYDAVAAARGLRNMTISKKMIHAVRNALGIRKEVLEKKKKIDVDSSQKRKTASEEIRKLEVKRRTVLQKAKEEAEGFVGATEGLDNAGKTTIVKRFNGEAIDSISPTLGFNIKTIEHKGFMLNIWDVGGQKSLRSYWRNYFESTDGLIWVVDCADKRRLDDCRKELHELLQEERLLGATLLVFANKQDLPGSFSSQEITDILELNLIKTHNWKIVGCSAVTGDNLVAGIDWLVSDISSRIFTLD